MNMRTHKDRQLQNETGELRTQQIQHSYMETEYGGDYTTEEQHRGHIQ